MIKEHSWDDPFETISKNTKLMDEVLEGYTNSNNIENVKLTAKKIDDVWMTLENYV